MSPHDFRHRRPPVHLRPSRWRRRWFYALGLLLAISGIGWLVCHDLLRPAGAELPHPLEPWWLRLHGAAVTGFLIVLGSLLPTHIVPAWRRHRWHRSGVAVLAVLGGLTVTGYGLYYAGGDTVRALTSDVHWILGLASIAATAWHVAIARRERRHARAAHGHGGHRGDGPRGARHASHHGDR